MTISGGSGPGRKLSVMTNKRRETSPASANPLVTVAYIHHTSTTRISASGFADFGYTGPCFVTVIAKRQSP